VRLSGTATRVPWGARAARVAVLAETPDGRVVCSVDPRACAVQRRVNLAGEPRDTLDFDGVVVGAGEHAQAPVALTADVLERRGALLRAAQIAGALTATLELSVAFAGERVQFGRPIAAFQAVGSLLALLAAESAAAVGAVDAALAAFADGGDAANEVAAAKVRAGQAAGAGAEMAHQIHGAIGYTREHRLHLLTRRLWSWRDEYGSEAVWAQRLGHSALEAGGSGLWPLISGTRAAADGTEAAVLRPS
jgi:acyl-CoA dehydrogenase